ncbi:hypothetical protein XELAEV_18031008mg [Xenopus laevis]|uniref:Uncharacterized protein n=1 Tax=Xenopus laevis TaxID=8355 RepID=A0A974CP55_XENLA|nr:hypothetical protein XELAEV_18031008mg [Xenopus laevis]
MFLFSQSLIVKSFCINLTTMASRIHPWTTGPTIPYSLIVCLKNSGYSSTFKWSITSPSLLKKTKVEGFIHFQSFFCSQSCGILL